MDLQFSMLIGLAATQFVDSIGKAIADEAESQTIGHVVTVITLVLSAGIAGFFVLLGFFAKRLWTWPYYIGLPIYALDGVVFLAFGDYLSAGFHAFVIFMLWGGLSATRALRKAEGLQAADGAMPGPSVE